MIKHVWKRLSKKEYRDHFVSSKIDSYLSAQIYALREQHGLTQEELGERAAMAQSRIARLEGSCEGVGLTTLKRLASAFDVALIVRFVPFSDFISDHEGPLDRQVNSFENDQLHMSEFRKLVTISSGNKYLEAHSEGHSAQDFNFQTSLSSSSAQHGITIDA